MHYASSVQAMRLLHGRQMALAKYIVICHEGRWRVFIFHEGQCSPYGTYSTQREAVGVAIDAAHNAGQQGTGAQVTVQSTRNDNLYTIWIYGRDPYPPQMPEWIS